MIEPQYVNPKRRDILKKLAALGIVGLTTPVTGQFLYSDFLQNNVGEKPGTWKDDEGYEALRTQMSAIANVPHRFPDVIVQPQNEDELLKCLEFANENDLQLVCRTSGHNTAGAVLRNGGMLMDISKLNKFSIDPKAKTATVQPATTFKDFLPELKKYGFGYPHGDCGDVAFGGYLLGGGLGKNGNHYTKGPASNSIISAEVILANGQKIIANKNENSDIFWALRGCGPGFFGIIWSFTIQLYEPIEAIVSNRYVFPLKQLEAKLDFFEKASEKIPLDDRVHKGISLIDDKENPGQLLVSVSISATTLRGDDAVKKAKNLVKPFVELGIAKNSISKSEYQVADGNFKLFSYPSGFRTNTDNIYTDDPKALLAVVDHFKSKPKCMISMGISLDAQVHPHQKKGCYSVKGKHFVNYHCNWFDNNLDEAAQQWLVKTEALLKPYKTGHYINQTDNATFPDHIEACFSKENWQRLGELRKKYDLNNRFYSYLGLS